MVQAHQEIDLHPFSQQVFLLNSLRTQPIFENSSSLMNVVNRLIQIKGSNMWLHELLHAVRTLQQTLEAQLQHQRAEIEKKRCYVHYLMHDVKNALTGIVSCAEVLGVGELEPEEKEEFFRIIASEIERVVGMTQDLMDFASGKHQALQLQSLHVNDFMQSLLSIIKHALAGRNISIQLDLQYTGQFQVDVEKMKCVFLNIVYNARDAMPDGGSLTITSRIVNDVIQFEFTDTGCGMSPELQARFLEPFVTAGKPNGTGLGMAIVKDILDQHHGRIEAESAVAKGTTIHISLPQVQRV